MIDLAGGKVEGHQGSRRQIEDSFLIRMIWHPLPLGGGRLRGDENGILKIVSDKKTQKVTR